MMAKHDHLELGLFGLNARSGIAMTTVPERWSADWPEIVETARYADKSGIDFILPIARWRGYGGETDPTGACYETFTFSAALASLTERARLFSTVHVPFVHPTYAARAAATVDQASNGRAGVNIVCGFIREEFNMFGLAEFDLDDRYNQGSEWVEVFEGLLSDDDFFTYEGEFYKVTEGVCQPVSRQRPRPKLLSAAFSPYGREFAMRKCDCLFTMFSKYEISKRHNEALRAQADELGSEVDIFTSAHVVCRETQQEAEDYYDYYADEMADDGAVTYFVERIAQASPKVGALQKIQRKRIAGGAGSVPLIGTPKSIAEQLESIHGSGFNGIGLSFVNFKDELPYFVEKVIPLLEKGGVRKAA
jgi:alkanesulfonate monooxygenase SsuD/methylene tetrahydromethanopterin reductase-like flavin-dependent oxidoreductase (luciferase family)